MYLYNTQTNCKEELHPTESVPFRIYTCYLDSNHLQALLTNIKLIILTDWIHRAFVKQGYIVTQVYDGVLDVDKSQFNLITSKSSIQTNSTEPYNIQINVSSSVANFVNARKSVPNHITANCEVHSEALFVREPIAIDLEETSSASLLNQFQNQDIEPLAFRYFLTNAHYRNRLNFNLESLKLAQSTLNRLRNRVINLFQLSNQLSQQHNQSYLRLLFSYQEEVIEEYNTKFWQAINDDLALPKAISILWKMLKLPYGKIHPASRLNLLFDWDQMLGFDLKGFLENK
jgi:cysteinyl-tRNA synthetase